MLSKCGLVFANDLCYGSGIVSRILVCTQDFCSILERLAAGELILILHLRLLWKQLFCYILSSALRLPCCALQGSRKHFAQQQEETCTGALMWTGGQGVHQMETKHGVSLLSTLERPVVLQVAAQVRRCAFCCQSA